MNRLTKTIAAIIAVCLLSVSGVAFAISDCNALQKRTLDAVIDLLDESEKKKFWPHLQGISCNQIVYHFRGAAMTSAPACVGPTTCTLRVEDDEGGGDITDCEIIIVPGEDTIASCN